MSAHELILGHHSIHHALINKKRNNLKFIYTVDGLKIFKQNYPFKNEILKNWVKEFAELSNHDFQVESQKIFKTLKHEYSRIQGGMLLLSKTLPDQTIDEFLEEQEEQSIGSKKIVIALDQVTDIHNAAAILRSSAFFKVSACVIEGRGTFGITPSFTRIASGALEYVKIVKVNSLTSALKKLKDSHFKLIGLSEESQSGLNNKNYKDAEVDLCLVLGAEDKGISHSVERLLDENLSLQKFNDAPIASLNVSVAAALALERLTGSIKY